MEIWYTLTGEINSASINEAIMWINNQFYSSDITKLKFFISSTGGDVDAGTRLYDYLKGIPTNVETYGFGQVDSAAILIFLSGKKRFALQNCRFRIHEGVYTGETVGTSLGIHKEVLEFLKELSRRSNEIIAVETKNKIEEIEEIKSKGKILTTKDAIEMGLLHKIIEKLPLKKEN